MNANLGFGDNIPLREAELASNCLKGVVGVAKVFGLSGCALNAAFDYGAGHRFDDAVDPPATRIATPRI